MLAEISKVLRDFGLSKEINTTSYANYMMESAEHLAEDKSLTPQERRLHALAGLDAVREALDFTTRGKGDLHERLSMETGRGNEPHGIIVRKALALKSRLVHGAFDRSSPQTPWNREKFASHYRGEVATEKKGQYVAVSVRGVTGGVERLIEFLKRHLSIVVISDPGCGKTWSIARFMVFLFGLLMAPRAPHGAELWVPLLFAVNEFMQLAGKTEGSRAEGSLLEFLRTLLRTHPPSRHLADDPAFVLKLAEAGGLCIMLDGLNEISIADRPRFAGLLRALREHFPYLKLIITSRKLHWDPQLLPELNTVVEVMKLTDDDVNEFIDAFFGEERRAEAEKMRRLISGNESRRGMAAEAQSYDALDRTPLFLDLRLSIFARKGRLPEHRGDVFAEFIDEYAVVRSYFPLQKWVLGIVGLHMVHQSVTSLSAKAAEDLLYLGFLTAPPDQYCWEGSRLLPLSGRCDAAYLGPEEVAALISGKDARNGEMPHRRFYRRFSCREEKIREAFQTFMQSIRRNGSLEFVADSCRFWHQSLGEFFAARRFLALYRNDRTTLLQYIRQRKYDEMLHIVISMIVDADKELVQEILETLTRGGSHMAEVRDCLSKMEHIDGPALETVLSVALQFIHEPTVPGPCRALSIECLPYLGQHDMILELLRSSALEEQPVMWKTLLDACWTICAARDDGPELTTLLYEGLEKRGYREENLMATAEWIGQKRRIELGGLLIDMMTGRAGPAQPGRRVMKACWDAFRSLSIPLSEGDWNRALDRAEDPSLFELIFTLNPSGSAETLFRRHFLEERDLRGFLDRYSEDRGWHVPIRVVLRAARELAIEYERALQIGAEICEEKKDFPESLLYEIWTADASLLLKLRIDRRTLEWLQGTDEKKVPSGFGSRIRRCLEEADAPNRRAFRRNIRELSLISWTYDHDRSGGLCESVEAIVRACHETGEDDYWQAGVLPHLLTDDTAPVRGALREWETLPVADRLAWMIVFRARKDSLDPDLLVPLWRREPGRRFADMLFAGAGTDRFIRHQPLLIQESLRDRRFAERNIRWVRRLGISNSSYSTRIVIYTTFQNSELEDLSPGHPGHPAPVTGSDAHESLERLLGAGMTNEAAYILAHNDSYHDSALARLPKELHGAFKSAVALLKTFGPVGEAAGARVGDHSLFAEASLDRMIVNAHVLKAYQLSLFLDGLFICREEGLLAKRLKALRNARVWKQAEVPFASFENAAGSSSPRKSMRDIRSAQFWKIPGDGRVLSPEIVSDLVSVFTALAPEIRDRLVLDIIESGEWRVGGSEPMSWKMLQLSVVAEGSKSLTLEPGLFRSAAEGIVELSSQAENERDMKIITDAVVALARPDNVDDLEHALLKALSSPRRNTRLKEAAWTLVQAAKSAYGVKICIPAALLISQAS